MQKLEELIAAPDEATRASAERTKERIRTVFADGRKYQAALSTLRSKLSQVKTS
jgi:hypothetical protein